MLQSWLNYVNKNVIKVVVFFLGTMEDSRQRGVSLTALFVV